MRTKTLFHIASGSPHHVGLAAAGAENTSSIHVVPESAAVTAASTAKHSSNGSAGKVVGGSAAPIPALHVIVVASICQEVHTRVKRRTRQDSGRDAVREDVESC